ncbi:hypothetical protein Dimus_017599 [Dionaea muscipula]
MNLGGSLSEQIGAMSITEPQHKGLKEIIRDHALPLLPAKSLTRCLLVCKDWRRLISDPLFMQNQSNSFRNATGIFYQRNAGSAPSFLSIDPTAYGVPDPQLTFLPEPVVIRASSNGLLCCLSLSSSSDDQAYYYICNPVTKEFRKLPKSNADHGTDPAVVLIFEPSLVNSIPDYKLICAFRSTDTKIKGSYQFEMYSSEEDTWKVFGQTCITRSILPTSGVHLKGVVYWQTNTRCDQVELVIFNYIKDRVIVDYIFNDYGVMGVFNGRLCKMSLNDVLITISTLRCPFASREDSAATTWRMIYKSAMDFPDKAIALEFRRSQKHEHAMRAAGTVVFIFAGSKVISHDMETGKTAVLLSGKAEYDLRSVYVPYVNNLVRL